MSVSRSEAAVEARRQLRSVRTETELVADTLMVLFEHQLLRFQPEVVRRVADVAGITVAELRAAKVRYDRRGYVPPASTSVAITAVPEAPSNGAFHDDDSARRYAEGARRGQRAGGEKTSRQPTGGADFMRCSRCQVRQHIAEFNRRADRPHSRWTVCNDCRRQAQRDRYLSVEKRRAINAARLTFIIGEDDDVVHMCCMDCGRPLATGDHVYGDASLHHVDCTTAKFEGSL